MTPTATATATPTPTATASSAPTPTATATATGTPATTSDGPHGWTLRCPYSHSLHDDPIVAPGQPGAAHLHDFVGNTSTDAHSTYASMLTGGTTCKNGTDTASYWTPALFNHGVHVPQGDGTAARPLVYYRDKDIPAGATVTPFPPDFRVIAGNARATTAAENPQYGGKIFWGCYDGGRWQDPPASCPSGVLEAHVGFPTCWDGIQTGRNDTAHVTYSKDDACPPTHPIHLARLTMVMRYAVGTGPLDITLSSGGPHTLHADFWNTWDQATLERLTRDCLNADVDCGANPL